MTKAMDSRSVAPRVACVGLDRPFDMSHYLPGHNAFDMARLQVGKPVMTVAQERARAAQDRTNERQRAKRGAVAKTATEAVLRVNKYDPICEPSGMGAQIKAIAKARKG